MPLAIRIFVTKGAIWFSRSTLDHGPATDVEGPSREILHWVLRQDRLSDCEFLSRWPNGREERHQAFLQGRMRQNRITQSGIGQLAELAICTEAMNSPAPKPSRIKPRI